MSAIFEAFKDQSVRDWYLLFCFSLLVLPMVGLTWWYHRGINDTEGGRKLMQRQNRSRPNPRGTLGKAHVDMAEGMSMMRDIKAGRYGEAARAMQGKVYWVVGFWILANTLAFGLIIWADEVNRDSLP